MISIDELDSLSWNELDEFSTDEELLVSDEELVKFSDEELEFAKEELDFSLEELSSMSYFASPQRR